MKNVSMIFWIIFLNLMVLSISACDLSSNIPITKNVQNLGPSETIDSVRIVSTNGEVAEWKINAEKVDRYTNSQQWIGYKVRFESLSGNDKSIITCNEADIDEVSNIIKGKGNVIINSPKGYLKTELLIFNRLSTEIHAPGYVHLKRGSSIINGTNLTTNVNFDYIDIKNVSGQGTMNEEITN